MADSFGPGAGTSFSQVSTVSYQGLVIAFARADAPPTGWSEVVSVQTDIYYNVLSLDVDSAHDDLDWGGWKRLEVPNEVRPSGMQLINVPLEYDRSSRIADLADAGVPFRTITDQEYVYVLRQAVGGTLLVNRFRLVRSVSPKNAQEVEYVLSPAWEVRFQRSGKPDIAYDDKDVQGYLSPDREPFVEPALELPIPGITDGRFDAALLPRADGTLLTCAVAVLGEDHQVDLYELPLDAAGRFLLAGKTLEDDHLAADVSFTLETPDKVALTLTGRPALLYHLKQERVLAGEDDSFLVKRAGRLLLAMRAQAGGDAPSTLATVDLGAAADGTVARPAAVLTADPVGVAPYALAFDSSAHVDLPDLVLTAGFAVELWLYPRSDVDPQLVVGNPDDPAAPRLSLIEGSAVEFGFSDADGNPLVARTGRSAVRREVWSHVEVDFDPQREVGSRFVMRVNGEVLPHEEAGTASAPGGSPITSLSAADAGFVGTIDSLAIYGAADTDPAHAIGSWPLDTVRYVDDHGAPIDPPETPNEVDPTRPGLVVGADLVPSTSPASTGNGGALTFDDRGLSILTSYFADLTDFGEIGSSPALLAGADGLLHCYFGGRADRFCVMQRDDEAARAAFQATWSAAAGTAQDGPIQFIASQAGAFMDGATITIADPAGGSRQAFCDVTMTAPSGRVETWRGLPRSVVLFASAINGEAVHDPSDRRLVTGAATYYDASGTRTAAYVPLEGSVNEALAGVVTRHPERVPLASLEATAVTDEMLDLTLTHDVPRWPGVSLVQSWPRVPARIGELMSVLDGASTTYPYASDAPANVRSYSIGAESGVMDADTVILLTNPTVSQVDRIVVRDGSRPDLCSVDISLVDADQVLDATWTDVDRQQNVFAAILEGDDPGYDYRQFAQGQYAEVGAALVIVTDGNTAEVSNVRRVAETDGLPSDDDLRVFASLFEPLVTAPTSVADRLPATGPVTALAFQGATVTVDDRAPAMIAGASGLFHVHLAALPDQGSVGLVANTAGFVDGTAVLVRQGINGGWRNRPDQRTLSFAGEDYVDFATGEAQAPNIAALTIQGDLSLELWTKPRRSVGDAMQPNQRLVTFARTPSPAEGGDRVRYLAGLQDCSSLRTKADTTVRAAYTTNDGTFYTWFSPLATGGAVGVGTIGSLSTLGITRPVVSISVDADKHIRAEFMLDAAAPPIVSTEEVAAGEWYQVALPWSVVRSTPKAGTYQYDFTVDLYVGAERVGTQQWQVTRSSSDPIQLATMVIGEIEAGDRATLPMRVNEAGFFARPLAPNEMGRWSEQRIPDNASDLIWKWMLLEGKGSTARNSAASGPTFDGDIKPSATWEKFGLYSRPTLGHGDNIAVLTEEPVIHGWTHLAMVHQGGFALDLRGADYANCGHGSTTDLSDTFSIEAWVELAASTGPPQIMTVLGKGDDYELGVTQERYPRFAVQVEVGDVAQTFELRGPTALAPGVTHHLTVTYELVTVEVPADQAVDPRYEVHMDLWVDGEIAASGMKDGNNNYIQYTDIVQRISTRADLNLGRTTRYGGSRYLRGYLSDTRLWSRLLREAEIVEAVASRRSPPDRDGLVSWWRFNESGGRIAFDAQGNNDALLNRGDLRVGYQPTSTNDFYVDGRPAAPTWVEGPSSVGGYPDGDQFAFGRLSGDNPIGFHGQIDSVRIWSTQLTGEQVSDSMHRTLSGGERHLAGLWTFDNGSGPVVEDATGRGNTGHLTGDPGPVWSASTVPLGNEAPGVMNILGGIPTFTHDVVTETPSVIEYADLQRDAYGAIFSVMKRAYVAVDDGTIRLVAGYKVGDLDTVYLGQAQSKPSVIGFVEGAPPIPSENQTMPYWKYGGRLLNSYAGSSSVTLEEADETTYAYNAARETSDTHALAVKAGLYFGDDVKASVGIGAEVESMAFKYKGHVGVQEGFQLVDHDKKAIDRATGTSLTMTSSLSPGGAWEPGDNPEDWVNPTVGRRYLPANAGMALVKSLTVDLYASILTTTRSMVKLTSAPNPDIPEDVNILTFPIDPQYVKNGTLDGKVGLENDPAYGNADSKRGSYFKPLEAYSLKRRIEREQARLAGYYDQYDVSRYASQLRNGSSFDDYRVAQRANQAYDWASHLAKRNIVNTYVWTALGGTYAEQTSTMDVYTESFGAVSSRTGKLGAVGDIEMSFPVVGFFVDFDYLYSWATEVNVVRSKKASAAFSLSTTVEPDAFLHAPVIEGDEVTFTSQPTEGKVDGYRYLAFYLAPTTDNFDDLSARVIDRHWLTHSMDASAVALREATASPNGAWRVLYRVTYVSRIPPKFQPVPDQTRPPDLEPPANVEYNALLIELIDRAIDDPDPSPLDIGTGISAVIGSADAPGPLAGLLPWWPQFLADTADYQLPAARILRTLREDLLRYMIEIYAMRADAHD